MAVTVSLPPPERLVEHARFLWESTLHSGSPHVCGRQNSARSEQTVKRSEGRREGRSASRPQDGADQPVGPEPPAVAAQPTAVDGQPTAVGAQPTPVDGQPTAVGAQPTPVDGQPTSVGRSPSAASDRPGHCSDPVFFFWSTVHSFA